MVICAAQWPLSIQFDRWWSLGYVQFKNERVMFISYRPSDFNGTLFGSFPFSLYASWRNTKSPRPYTSLDTCPLGILSPRGPSPLFLEARGKKKSDGCLMWNAFRSLSLIFNNVRLRICRNTSTEAYFVINDL